MQTPEKSANSASKVVLVTGASSGFGFELVRKCLASGYQVAATARRLDPLLSEFSGLGGQIVFYNLDITDSEQVKRIVGDVIGDFGKIDILINNAGYGLVGALEEYTEQQIERCWQTNFIGHVNVIRALLPSMRAQKSGLIINMSAIAGLANEIGFSIYGGAKFALEGLSESLASEVRHLGIKVMLVEPGPFRTDFIARSLIQGENKLPDYERSSGKFIKMLESINGKQPGDPVKAAELIVSLFEEEKLPLRLVLGKYAIERALKKLHAMEKEITDWHEKTIATDY